MGPPSASTKPATRTVLVTGATGQQGGAVARTLLEHGHRVRAFTRSAAKADALRQQGAEIVVGNFERPETVERAAKGADGIFVMATPFQTSPEAETREGIAAIDAAVQAKVPHILYSSVSDADRDTGIPHFDSKRRIEEHLEGAGVPYTIVAPVFFRENLLSPWMRPGIEEGRLDLGLPSDRSLQTVELREIGQFCAKVLEQPDKFRDQRINLASDECTPLDMARAIEDASGKRVRHNEVPIEQVRKQSDDQARMMEWFNDVGYSADIEGLRTRHPDIEWRTFKEWAAEAWSRSPTGPAHSTRTQVPKTR